MKYSLKHLLFPLLLFTFFSLFISSTSAVNAQTGTYTCRWRSETSSCISVPSCEDGYIQGHECPNKTEEECNNSTTYECVVKKRFVCVTLLKQCQDVGTGGQYATSEECNADCSSSPPAPDRSKIFCSEDKEKINTAIGCIPSNVLTETIKFLLQWSIGIGGAIAMVILIIAGVIFMTSQGNPKKTAAAKELIFAALTGLLLLVLSVYLLRIIGVDILQLQFS